MEKRDGHLSGRPVSLPQRRDRARTLIDRVPLIIGLGTNPQDHDGHHLVSQALIVLNRRQYLPDDAVAVAASMNGEAAFPFPFQGIPEIRCALNAVEEAAWSLDFTVSLRIAPPEQSQALPRSGRERQFVSLCRG